LRPKHELIIKVKKDKDSHLGLTLIDQSTLLMRQGGDLTKKQIFNDLQKYDNANSIEMEIESQTSDAYVNLLESGVVVLSNAEALKGRFNASGLEKARLAAGHPLSYTTDILSDFIIPVMPTCNIEDLDEASQKELRNTEIVRNTFPEVVLWEDFTDGENVTVIKTQLPDSMTSWALSGYSLSSELGLGITKSPLILTVFKPFFIEANVPYSAVRGDLVTMVVSVHNYFNQKVRVEVMIDKSDDFEIIADGRNLPDYSSYEDNDYEQKNEEQNIIYVQAEDVKSTLFTLRTKTVGQIPIIVRATSEIACDAIQQNLLVKPEGVTVTRSQTKTLVITPATKPQTFRFNIAVPTTAIEDSVKIQLTVQGDKYSLDLQNVENNIKLPSGSGVSYALDWRQYAANTKYVITSKPFMCGLEDTVLTNLGKGLANLNQQRCSDGGFTNTGDCDENNRDTWFTAFNLATQAALIPYKLAIDVQALYGTVNFLVGIQLPDGSFPEKSWELTTHAFESGPKLTSYVVLTLLMSDENMPIKLKYADSIDKAVNYLLKNLDKLDLLTLTSLYYSLQMLDHKKRTEVYYVLNKRSSKSALSKRWLHKSSDAWTEVDDLQNFLNGLLFNSDHVDILQTAHGLTKSLVEQYDQSSSQAKSKVISALSDFAAAFSVQSPNLTVSFAPSGAPIEIVFLTKNNRFLLHQYEFHPKIRNVDFTAVGQGFVNLEIKYQYNLVEDEVQKQFALTVDVVPLDFEGWQLDICTNFKPTSDGSVISKIAVMDVSIPAGFKTTEYVRNFDKAAPSIVVGVSNCWCRSEDWVHCFIHFRKRS
jgi:CD109 antigen